MDYVQIQRDMIQMNKFVTLTADVMFVNNLPLVITYGREIGLITAEFMPNQWQSNQHVTKKESLVYVLELVFLVKLF